MDLASPTERRGLATADADGPQPAPTGWLHGVVGGCGATTLATALQVPETPLSDVPSSAALLVLACPVAVDATARLLDVVSGLDPDLDVAVAALDDGRGPTPRAARARLRRIVVRTRVVPVPYVHAWRWSGHDPASATRRWTASVRRLAAMLERRGVVPAATDVP